jgi:ELWxxDGT repeat protein
MKPVSILVLICALTVSANAQVPALVKDSWPGKTGITPFRLLTFGDRLCFFATDPSHGTELWEYNDQDTPKMVADIYPGYNSSGGATPENDHMIVYKNKLYFQASSVDAVQGKFTGDELFVYDGMTPPKMAFKLGKTSVGSNPNGLAVAGGKLFFAADTNNGGFSLYSYDGVNAPKGYPIKPNYVDVIPSRVLGEYNGSLYFSADSGNGAGRELYTLDPATDHWKMVADINTGSGPSTPSSWLSAWNKLFFLANTSKYGLKLYVYDGDSVQRLTDYAPGPKSSTAGAYRLIAYKGGVYFTGTGVVGGTEQELYKWDSASGNTSQISPAGVDVAGIYRPIVFDNCLYFYGKTVAAGREVWKYDGTSCKMVTDLFPGPSDGVWAGEFAEYNGRLYFGGNNGYTGFELYRINPVSNAVTSIKWAGKALVYPNPTSSFAILSISLPAAQSLRISLTDMSGREVFDSGLKLFEAGNNEIRLPVANLSAGQYFYRVDRVDGMALAQGAVIRL